MEFGGRLSYGTAFPSHAFDTNGLSGQQYTIDTLSILNQNGFIGSRGIIIMGQNYSTTGNYISSTGPNGPRWVYQGDVRWASSGNQNFAYITGDGRLFTWGSSATGLGRGASGSNIQIPTQVGTDTDWRSVHCGALYMLATKTDGTLWSWGANANGKTGQGTSSGNTNSPLKIGSKTDWSTIISCGDDASFAVDTSNNLYSFGSANFIGSGGVGATVPTLLSFSGGNIQKLSSNFNTTAMIADGKLYTTGSNTNHLAGQGTSTGNTLTFTQVGTATDWVDVNIGVYAAAGIRSGTNGYWGWGSNNGRALGYDASSTNVTTPTQFHSFAGSYLRVNCTGGGTTICGTTAVKADGTLVLNGQGNMLGLTPGSYLTSDTIITQLPTNTQFLTNTDAVVMVLQ